ncbi:MAG TPA: dihydrodipicolinate synthase family protein [Bryobacteraceae bacterium]|nr:dihydrodipicolinate synthase family protein [Bryobacteraceae bacterium]
MTNSPIPATGIYAALATPRQPNASKGDAAALLDYLDAIVAAGVDGLVLFGSTGEFVHFDVEERMRILMLAIKRSRVPMLVNVSHSTLAGALDLAEGAIANHAAGVLLMPPYFYRYTEDQIGEFYSQFAKELAGRVPIYLYNTPQFTNAISAGLAERLFSTGAFAGIEDSSGDWQLFTQLSRLRPGLRFQLLLGSESVYFRAKEDGADGLVSGIAAALPELIVALHRALASNDSEYVSQLNARVTEFLAYVGKFPATIVIKQAAFLRGWNLNNFAFPLDEDSAAELIGFRGWFREWLPETLAMCAQMPPSVQ